MKKTFYGWWVLLGLFLIYAASNGIGLNTLPLFYPSLINEFGWDAEEVTRPASLLYLLVAFISPFAGILLDKYKTKTIMSIGALGLIGALLYYTQVKTLGQLSIVYIIYAVSLTAAGIISSMYLITKWFHRYRGLAVGIFLMASSFGGVIFPQLAKYLIVTYNWQTAILGLAIASAVFILVPVFFLIKNKPEDLGLLPDGDEQKPQQIEESPSLQEGFTLNQVLQSPTFYLLLVVTASFWFCITGIINHQIIYFKDLKIDIKVSANVLSLFFFCSIIGKLIFGYLSDKFNKMHIMFLATVNLAIGSTLLPLITDSQSYVLYVYAIVYGIGFSGAFTMIQVVVADFYQGKSYGRILGIVTGADTLAGSMGIIILGSMRKNLGTYYPSFNLLITICIIASICVLLIKKPSVSKTD